MQSNLMKMVIVGLSVVSLIASGSPSGGGSSGGGTTGGGSGGGGNTGNGLPTVIGSPLVLVNPSQALGSFTESTDGKNVSANLTFRANSAFFANNSYSKVQGHELKAKFGHTETGNAASFVKNAGAFTGILSSATLFITLDEAAKTLSVTELNQLSSLRFDISTLENFIETQPANAQILFWKQSLKNKLQEIASLISYGGLQVSLRSLASGNGFYGLFVNNDNGDYKQISGIYAVANGKSTANYASVQAGGGTSVYNGKFSGAAVISGIQLIDLKGTGTVSANFSSQTLSANFALSNQANTETGNIAFSGSMGANASGKTGMIFDSNAATYTRTAGQLNSMIGGKAEVALIDSGNSILGSVNFTSGGNALVGGFGGDKQ